MIKMNEIWLPNPHSTEQGNFCVISCMKRLWFKSTLPSSWDFFGTVCSSIFTIPVGASIGSIMAKAAEMKAMAYAIGPNDWRIIYE